MIQGDPYLILKLEFPGIKDTIASYSSDGLIGNYLEGMQEALEKDETNKVLYYLKRICDWYEENIRQINTNGFVYNKPEHAKAKAMLESFYRELQDYDFSSVTQKEGLQGNCGNGNEVFIVHGHDNEAKISVARMIEQLGLKAIILHEQADGGNTIIQKLESYRNVAYAIVLYTECDIGRAREADNSENKFRARQNVVFEHGLFWGLLGKERVCAVVKGNVETPGDISGLVYVPMDDAGAWKMHLCKNMKAAGINIDLNKLV